MGIYSKQAGKISCGHMSVDSMMITLNKAGEKTVNITFTMK